MKKCYNAIIEYTEEGAWMTFPDFPGCAFHEKISTNFREHGTQFLKVWIERMKKLGKNIPESSSPIVLEECLKLIPNAQTIQVEIEI